MSKVYIRDAQGSLIHKLCKRVHTVESVDDIPMLMQQLNKAWMRYQKLHDTVLDRAGKTEIEEQNFIRDGIYDAYAL